MTGPALSIGVLALDRLQQHSLRSLVEQNGYGLAGAFLLGDVCDDDALRHRVLSLRPKAWIVAPEAADSMNSTWVERDWLAGLYGNVIYCDGPVPGIGEPDYDDWERRLAAKLRQLAGAINLAESGYVSANQVWVLAASTGGPAAVKEFVRTLPPELDVGFVYAQHIDAGYETTLCKMFNQGSHYPAYQVQHGCVIRPNALGIVPADRATELLPNGTFLVDAQAWSGPYSPSIDCILASVAQSYGPHSGAIVFTGMGEDGAMACRLMRKNGGAVWAQSLESCTVDSMPRAAMATGCVEFEGSPEALAQKFAAVLSRKARGSASLLSEAKTIRSQ